MIKSNCWEFKKCGRIPGGAKAEALGACPAALEVCVDKINSGKNGGRCCWVIAGTLCGGQVQGTFAKKEENCLKCDFYSLVRKEEGRNLVVSGAILKTIHQYPRGNK